MNSSFLISRRALIGGTAVVALMLPISAYAISNEAAQSFVNKAIVELQSIVNKGSSGAGLNQDVAAFFRKYADVGYIGRAVIGAPWRGMSPEQQKDYTSAFEGYVVRKYSPQLKDLKGGTGKIVRAVDNGSSGIALDVDFIWPGFKPSKLNFLVSEVGGKPKVLDLKIYGVSMLSTERVLVRTALTHRDNDIDKLIAYLQKA